MTGTRWHIHPAAVIVHHAGHLLAARLSCSARPVPVSLADIVLLDQFRSPAPLESAVHELTDGAAHLSAGRPDPRQLRQRMAQLHAQGVLIVAAEESPPRNAVEALCCADLHERSVLPAVRYRLSRNFALFPRPDGFEVRSPTTGDGYRLGLELALLLLRFTDGHTVAELARSLPMFPVDQIAEIAAWFSSRGLLVPAAGKAGAAGDYRREVPLRRGRGASWRDLQPDGRIPVYFVPHMENHFPLALGMIYSALAHWRDGALQERFQLIPISYLSPQAFLQGPYHRFGQGVWLFSNYMWSLQLNQQISAAVKRHDAGNLTIHGGPSTPGYEEACREFMRRHPSVDVAVHGEGEVAACEALDAIERDSSGRLVASSRLHEVSGLSFRDPAHAGALVRTAARRRMRELDRVPSPYLTGVFDLYEARVEAAIIETNRGCPFKCTFCDWGSATNQKIEKFEVERIRGELEWIAHNRIGVLWIADANFGMLQRDLEIARWIIDCKRRHGYPQEVVVNYTKNANARLAEIIKVFTDGGIISQGIISIQTTDENTLEIIDRKNIKTEKYDELIEVFSKLGLPLSTDLMIGLPGMTPEAFDRDLQRYVDADVSVKAYPTQLLPNSPMAHPDYLRKYRIEVDANDYLVSCFSYTAEQLRDMHLHYRVYTVTDGYGTLRHVLRFLQWEHGISATDFMHVLAALAYDTPDRYPAISWVVRQFSAEKCMPGGWQRFYDEIAEFVQERFGIARDTAFDVVLRVNEAMMPDDARQYPLSLELAHNYAPYFAARNRRRSPAHATLNSYPPGRLSVSDPNGMAHIDFEYQQYDTHQFFWELHSPVSRAKAIAVETNRSNDAPVAV